jgi:hypothetical protein
MFGQLIQKCEICQLATLIPRLCCSPLFVSQENVASAARYAPMIYLSRFFSCSCSPLPPSTLISGRFYGKLLIPALAGSGGGGERGREAKKRLLLCANVRRHKKEEETIFQMVGKRRTSATFRLNEIRSIRIASFGTDICSFYKFAQYSATALNEW